ncbi:MAG TPA: LacI family DNA-binding transcriptional regulator [Streptosporangiaceae bacterium]
MDDLAGRRGPTIEDVAVAAGVSRGTVSRVLNGGRLVSPQAAAAVREAVQQTGYVVNHSARSLVTRRSNAVAFILSESHDLLFEDPNFSVLLRVATEALAAQQMTLFLTLNGGSDARDRLLNYVRGGYLDGVLLVSTHGDDPLFQLLKQNGVPTVVCGRPLGHENSLSYVSADDQDGARLVTQHLADRGYHQIAMITGPLDTSGAIDRRAGYREVLGSGARDELIEEAHAYSHRAGEEAMSRLLARAPAVDAVFAASDLLATGAIAALRRAGRRVPGDVAVAGFDDSRLAVTTDPPLTTVHQSFERLGEEMVRLLLRVISGARPQAVLLPTSLVIRESA